MIGWHNCLACEIEAIPSYRAFCAGCYEQVPWKLRASVMHAYRVRATRRRHFEEKLIELRQWMVHGTGRWGH